MKYLDKILCCAVSDDSQGVLVYDALQAVKAGNGSITVKPGEGFSFYVVVCINPAALSVNCTVSLFAVHGEKPVKIGNEKELTKKMGIPFGFCGLFVFNVWLEEDADIHVKVVASKPRTPTTVVDTEELTFSVKVREDTGVELTPTIPSGENLLLAGAVGLGLLALGLIEVGKWSR